jgi:two-component system chemotaxis response regulator CheB
MAQVKVVRRWADRQPIAAPPMIQPAARPRVVAIAASTGGPAALQRIVASLPVDFPVPILAVQHIARGFVAGFASWLNTSGSLRVKLAVDGEPLAPNTVYVAPDDLHLGMTMRYEVALSDAAPIAGFKPSATYTFASIAKTAGPAALAVILTGMGEDGVAGLRAVRASGGRIIAQDEDTSVVFGMPGAAVAAGLADWTLPIGAVAPTLLAILAKDESP